MSRFNYRDFELNPRKYELFCTARIATHIFTENGAHDLAEGTIVPLRFLRVVHNRMFRRDEPVYNIGDRDVYASALADFVP